jgi:ubiquitin-conjugating enzyme E2 variant
MRQKDILDHFSDFDHDDRLIIQLSSHPYLVPSYTILQTQHDGRFYELRIRCPDRYPAVPPEVRFATKINMTCVDSKTGNVNANKVPAMRGWNRNMGIEQVLTSLRSEMCNDQNRRLRQPSEGGMW